MIFQGINVSGSMNVTGSFVVPKGTANPATASSKQGDLFFNTELDSLVVFTTSGSWTPVGDVTASADGGASTNIEYLLVAGGGSGGSNSAGGGGAGGLLSSSLSSVVSGSSFTVTVGAGASGVSYDNDGLQGVNSTISGTSISTITSIGGGGGIRFDTDDADGGSGGGGGATAGTGTVGQGNDGGVRSTDNVSYTTGGGGGGALAAGGNGSSTLGGSGGNGKTSMITGTSTTYAGGGGGAGDSRSSRAGGTGGSGGGGNGGYNSGNGLTAGGSNTGGGSGGNGYSTGASLNGGSGVAIFAYDSGSINAAGGIVGDAGNGRKYHQLNESGTFKIGSTSDFQIITESLSAHFDAAHFSSRGSSTWTDLRGNGNGSISGATLNTHYYTFDGSNDVVNISGEKLTSDNMSIEVWLTIDNPSESGTYREIISQQANSNRGLYFGKTSTANQLRFGNRTYNFSSINASTFTHLVATRNSSGGVIFYENGSQGGTASGHTFSTSQGVYNNTGTRIGRQYGNYTEYWDGNIAQVRFYNKTLSAAEVLQNYNATKTNFI